MRIDENRKLAWGVLVACVLVSLFGLGGMALSRERSSVLKVFNEGTDTTLATRHSMDAYLDNAGAQAAIMASEAELRLGESDLSRRVQADAAILGDDSATLAERSRALTELKSDVEQLYSRLYSDDFKDFKLAYDDFWGQCDLIKRDGYHQLARDYNGLISGVPGGLVATVTRQTALDTFGG